MSNQAIELHSLLENEKREALGGKDAFLLTGGERVWFITSGSVDLFSVETQEGQAAGSRDHVARVPASELMFSFPSKETGVAILAVPGPGTEIIETSLEKLDTLSQKVNSREALAGLVEKWIEHITTRIVSPPPGNELTPLAAGSEEQFGTAESIVSPSSGLIWIKHIDGGSQLFGEQSCRLNGKEHFPLAEQGWITPDAGTRIISVDTPDLIATGDAWKGLKSFHAIALALIAHRRNADAELEDQRISQKRQIRSRAFHDGLKSLADILSASTERIGPPPEDLTDPLYAALCIIGKPLGMTFKPHPDARSGKEIIDPLRGILAASHLRKRSVQLRGRWWKEDCGPLLAFTKDDRAPVALLPTSAKSYDLIDPMTGAKRVVNKEIADTLHVNGVTFYRPFPIKELSGIDLLRYGMHGCARDLLMVAGMGVVGGVIGVIVPYLTGVVFDSVIPGARNAELLQITAILGITAFVKLLFNITRAIAMLRIETRMGSSVQAAVWDRVLALPVPFFREYTPGNLATRVYAIEHIRAVLSGVVATSILGGVFSIFYFALLFYYSMTLALVATLLVALAMSATLLTSWRQLHYERQIQSSIIHISGKVFQFVSGIAKLRVTGTEGNAFAIWARDFSKQRDLQFKARNLANLLDTFFEVFPLLANIAIYYFVAQLVLDGSISTGHFLAFNAAFISFLTASLAMSDAFSTLLMTAPMYESARPVLKTVPEVLPGKSDPGALAGAIELSHIAFRYSEDGPLILRDISLEINPGEFIAFVGPSGSGKSTIFRLLLGFETPESGTIYYDRQDQAGLDITALRQQVGVVLQNGKLLPGDIFTNIIGSSTTLTLEDAWEAARMAGFAEDIESMPMGMHTVVSEGGGTLSGGQRQRLMIARAIVNRPKMMFMDEATSALDNRTQEIVSKSLENLKATRIVIAHRLSTVVNADKIAVIEGGYVQELGTYDELMALDGKFANLAKRQLA